MYNDTNGVISVYQNVNHKQMTPTKTELMQTNLHADCFPVTVQRNSWADDIQSSKDILQAG